MLACDLCSDLHSVRHCRTLFVDFRTKQVIPRNCGRLKEMERGSSGIRAVMFRSRKSSACLAIALLSFLTKRICRILAAVVLRPYDFVLHLNQLNQGLCRHFSIKCSKISETALLFRSFPGFALLSFW